jgi:hypothetical protein
MKIIFVIAALTAGCTNVLDTRSLSNADASHAWFVQSEHGEQAVLYCDPLLTGSSYHELCLRSDRVYAAMGVGK